MREAYNSSIGSSLPGYIQAMGAVPFYVLFYTQQQAEFFTDKCRNGSGVLHIDCMGTVMKRMPEQKVPYYYAMVMQDHSMPVCEFLTTCHRHAWLMSVMAHFLRDVETVNAGR